MHLTSIFSIKTSAILIALSLVLAFVGFSGSSLAQNKKEICRGANLTFSDDPPGKNINCGTDAQGDPSATEGNINDLITSAINIFSIIVGIVAVVMVIVGGFKFITSGGDSAKVTSARNTIIYALIGLIIVALAQFIVKFVLIKLPT